ncbi:MAG TPA: histidinol-phosphate transaminase [Planktothrix sp.]|jgi:histidinol-phosphate/aromatic aminotransferase/cobyric acid decarboxylase-like protein
MFTKSAQTGCFHGGALYNLIGDDFNAINELGNIIDADVLDAWFPPSPKAVDMLRERLDWTLRCSPPVVASGVVRTISQSTGVAGDSIVCGAGSSSLIYLAMREWLKPTAKVLLLNPTYGEYAHVFSNVIGCRYDSFKLRPENDYQVDLDALVRAVRLGGYDMVVLVNPNNPTGRLIEKEDLQAALEEIPRETIVWIDEAYVDYADPDSSLAKYASASKNVVVCKSLSKALALSGLRVAYLACHPERAEQLRSITPPWSLSLLAQIVLIQALQDHSYYEQRYAETHLLREELSISLERCGFAPRTSWANFLLVDYPKTFPPANELISACRAQNLLLRNVQTMGDSIPNNCFRIAVKDRTTNARMVNILNRLTRTRSPEES